MLAFLSHKDSKNATNVERVLLVGLSRIFAATRSSLFLSPASELQRQTRHGQASGSALAPWPRRASLALTCTMTTSWPLILAGQRPDSEHWHHSLRVTVEGHESFF